MDQFTIYEYGIKINTMQPKDKTTLKIGATVSVIQSGLFLVIALAAWFLGIDRFISNGFASLYSDNQALFTLLCAAFVLVAILGVVITPAEKQVVGKYSPALAKLGGNLAYVGHFGTIMFFSWWLFFVGSHGNNAADMRLADTFVPIQWGVLFELLFVGFWVWVIAYTIFKYSALTKGFGLVSIAKATSFWLTLLAFIINNKSLLIIGLGGTAVVFGPWWHAWIAKFFWRFAKK
jgi:hypothetical protein